MTTYVSLELFMETSESHAAIRRDVTGLMRDVDGIKSTLSTIGEDVHEMKSRVESVAETNQELKKLSHSVPVLVEQMKDHTRALRENQVRIEGKDGHESRIVRVESRMQTVEKTVEENSERIDFISERQAKVEERVDSNKTNIMLLIKIVIGVSGTLLTIGAGIVFVVRHAG